MGIEHPVSSIEDDNEDEDESSIQHRVSNIEHPISNIQFRVSNIEIEHPVHER